MLEDLKQRIPFYLSDFYDGFVGEKTLHKTISATIFLYFACILPAIAFGVLNFHNTRKFYILIKGHQTDSLYKMDVNLDQK